MLPVKVLFVCIHNSARSQMAEAYLREFGQGRFVVESAGLTAGVLNPLVVEVMKEEGIDISQNKTKNVFDFYKEGRLFHYVITVCDEASAERCPIFPSNSKNLNWPFVDPSKLQGTDEEKLNEIRIIRNQIKEKVLEFVEELKNKNYSWK